MTLTLFMYIMIYRFRYLYPCVCFGKPGLRTFLFFASRCHPKIQERAESSWDTDRCKFPLLSNIGHSVARSSSFDLYPKVVSRYVAICFLNNACTASHGCPRADQPPGWRSGSTTRDVLLKSSPEQTKREQWLIKG